MRQRGLRIVIHEAIVSASVGTHHQRVRIAGSSYTLGVTLIFLRGADMEFIFLRGADMEKTLDEAALRALMRGEEGSVEFKERNPGPKEIGHYCVGISNDAGGWLIMGVTDKKPREIRGLPELTADERQVLIESVFDATNIRIEPQTVATSDGNVLAIKIPARRPGQVLFTKSGKYLIRSGRSLRGMTADEIAAILAETAVPSHDVVQRKVDEVELSFSLERANLQWAILNLENHSSEQVVVEQFAWRKDDVELTPPARVSYLLMPGAHAPMGWKPSEDPVTKLDLMVPPEQYAGYPPPFVTTIDTVLQCQILERKRAFPKKIGSCGRDEQEHTRALSNAFSKKSANPKAAPRATLRLR